MAHLDIPAVAGDQGARKFELLGVEATVGRAEGNDLVIIDGTLSRKHCEFFRLPDAGWGVRDLGSGNGVFIHEKRLTADCELADGEEVTLGSVIVVYRGGDEFPTVMDDEDDDVQELDELDIVD